MEEPVSGAHMDGPCTEHTIREESAPDSLSGNTRQLAGRFGRFVGTLSKEEAAEMQAEIDRAFGNIVDDQPDEARSFFFPLPSSG